MINSLLVPVGDMIESLQTRALNFIEFVDSVCRDSMGSMGAEPSGSSVCGQWLLRDNSTDQYMPHNITGLSLQITLSYLSSMWVICY